jgi:hypothetical protein
MSPLSIYFLMILLTYLYINKYTIMNTKTNSNRSNVIELINNATSSIPVSKSYKGLTIGAACAGPGLGDCILS